MTVYFRPDTGSLRENARRSVMSRSPSLAEVAAAGNAAEITPANRARLVAMLILCFCIICDAILSRNSTLVFMILSASEDLYHGGTEDTESARRILREISVS